MFLSAVSNRILYLLKLLNTKAKFWIPPAGVNSSLVYFKFSISVPFHLGVYLNEKVFLLLEVELLTCYIHSTTIFFQL